MCQRYMTEVGIQLLPTCLKIATFRRQKGVCGGGGFPKTWPAVPAVGGFEKNLFLGESHQGWGQPSSVHLRKSIPEHLGGI